MTTITQVARQPVVERVEIPPVPPGLDLSDNLSGTQRNAVYRNLCNFSLFRVTFVTFFAKKAQSSLFFLFLSKLLDSRCQASRNSEEVPLLGLSTSNLHYDRK